MPTIVSLSTIPTRFDKLEPVFAALRAQRAPIDEIRLYVPRRYRRFPDYDGQVPDVPRGVNVIRPEDDLGPATKVLFAADELRGTDCDIIFCDDDRIYPRWWFQGMLHQRRERLDHCVATSTIQLSDHGYDLASRRQPRPKLSRINSRRVVGLTRRKIKQVLTGVTERKPPRNRTMSRAGYAEIAEGCGAVLVRPEFFDNSDFDIPPVLWSVDDYWLSGQMARKGIPIWSTRGYRVAPYADHTHVDALYDAVIDGSGREAANHACVRYMQDKYGVWL